MKQRIDFFVVGAQKAGTTALHHYLSRHPDIFLPRKKETHFFSDNHGEYPLGIDYYLDTYFPAMECGEKLTGEVDPEYMFFPEVAQRLADFSQEAKIILVLRDPVSRAFSHYQMCLKWGFETLAFHDAIMREGERMSYFPDTAPPWDVANLYKPTCDDPERYRVLFNKSVQSQFSYVERGFYFKQINRYLAHFAKNQIMFILSEDLKANTQEVLKNIYRFLEVEDIPLPSIPVRETHRGQAPKSFLLHRFLYRPSLAKTAAKILIPGTMRLRLREMLHHSNLTTASALRPDDGVASHLRTLYEKDIGRLSPLIGKDLSSWLEPKL